MTLNALEGLGSRWISDLPKPEFPSCTVPSNMLVLASGHSYTSRSLTRPMGSLASTLHLSAKTGSLLISGLFSGSWISFL